MTPKPHKHKFEHTAAKNVMLYKGSKGGVAGKDTIKMLVCKCGKTQAYDLERTVA